MLNTVCNILQRLSLLFAEHSLRVVVARFDDECRLVSTPL